MSGQVHDVGSVIGYWPDPVPSVGIASAFGSTTGAALVVVARDMWAIRTELRRVALVDGRYVLSAVPMITEEDETRAD